MGKSPYLFLFVLLSLIVGLFIFKEHLLVAKDSFILNSKYQNSEFHEINLTEHKKEQDNFTIIKIQEYIDEIKQPYEIKKTTVSKKSIKPKLAIIIDDVAFSDHVESIKKLPFKITPSFFPKNERYTNTPALAKEFEHYMIHLPMEAYSFDKEESNTILISDLEDELKKKIKILRDDFPNAIFINNHTGSKFTSNFDAMNRLFYVLNLYGFKFLDSKTTVDTKGVEVGKIHNQKVLQRSVFLDNKADINYIKNQLKLAVKYAKENGFAIAIAHPREKTFEALMNSSDILKDVELVYVDELL